MSSTSGLLIKAVLKDAVGNEITKTYQMPKKYKVTNYKYSNTGVIATFDNEDTIDSNITSFNYLVGYYPTFSSGYVTRSYTVETAVDGVTLYGKMNSSTNAVTLYTSKLYTYKSNTGKEIKLFGDIGEGTACAAPSAALSWVNTGDYNPVVVKTTGTAPAVDYTLTRYDNDKDTGVAKLTFKIDITDFITNILGKNSSTFKDSDVDFALFTGDTDTRSKGSSGELLSDAKFTKTDYGKYTVECKIKTVHYTTESGDKFDYYYRVYVYDKYHASAPKAYSSDAFTIDSHKDTSKSPPNNKFDNTPPVIKDVKIKPDLQSIEATVYDVGIGDSSNNTAVWSNGAFYSDTQGRAFVDYWLIPYATSEEYNYLSKLSLKTLTDNYPKLSVPFDVSYRENTVYFSLESVYQDKFFIVAQLTDKSNNSFFKMIADINLKPFDYTDYVSLFKKSGGTLNGDYGSMELNYYATSTTRKTKGELYNDSQYDYWLVGDYFNEEKGEWAHEYSKVELGEQGSTSYSIVKQFMGENERSGQFQRYYILKTKEDNEIDANAYCTNPIYIFTKRTESLGARNDVYLKNDFVANITYDFACFVETAITPSKFIVDKDTRQERLVWDSKTKKTSPQLFKDDGNAEYSVDLSVANPGDYYRVIVHYDDGSMKMTDIKQVR